MRLVTAPVVLSSCAVSMWKAGVASGAISVPAGHLGFMALLLLFGNALFMPGSVGAVCAVALVVSSAACVCV